MEGHGEKFEQAPDSDLFDRITKGFEKANELKKQDGQPLQTKKEFLELVLSMHTGMMNILNKSIETDEQRLITVKTDLAQRDQTMQTLNNLLSAALEEGESSKIQDVQEMLRKMREKFTEDNLLDEISLKTKEIEQNRNALAECEKVNNELSTEEFQSKWLAEEK